MQRCHLLQMTDAAAAVIGAPASHANATPAQRETMDAGSAVHPEPGGWAIGTDPEIHTVRLGARSGVLCDEGSPAGSATLPYVAVLSRRFSFEATLAS